MKVIVEYLYGEEVTIRWEDIEAVIDACEMLQLPGLKHQVGKYVEYHINPDNCIVWFKLAEKFDFRDMGNKAGSIMIKDFKDVAFSDASKELSIAELLHYISDDQLQSESRDDILEPSIVWVDCDLLARKAYVIDILRKVQLEKCSLSVIENINKKYHHLLFEVHVQSYIRNAVLAHKSVQTFI